MEAKTELLPCPFCGTPAHFFCIDDLDSKELGGHGVCCDTPGCAQIGLMYACGDDPKSTLGEMWNKRAAHNAGEATSITRTPSDYLDAPGIWAQVYCCAVFVRGWTSEMARGAADHAVQEFGSDACKTLSDLEYTLDEVLRVD